ncbi:MAG: hypothetical protein Q7U47_15120 [Paludibacter sp.]|nr:hypothetical protein [Paludibacter sp.]
MEGSPISNLVGGQPEAEGIARTTEALNGAGSTRTVFTPEEREELEARGINPDWD